MSASTDFSFYISFIKHYVFLFLLINPNLYNLVKYYNIDIWKKGFEDSSLNSCTWFNCFLFFSVTCVIMQTNTGAGLSVSSTCYWDKATDCKYFSNFFLLFFYLINFFALYLWWNFKEFFLIVSSHYYSCFLHFTLKAVCVFSVSFTVRWENKSVVTIVNVFAVAIWCS